MSNPTEDEIMKAAMAGLDDDINDAPNPPQPPVQPQGPIQPPVQQQAPVQPQMPPQPPVQPQTPVQPPVPPQPQMPPQGPIHTPPQPIYTPPQPPVGQQRVYPNPPVQPADPVPTQQFGAKKPDFDAIKNKINASGITDDKKKMGVILGGCAAVVVVVVLIIAIALGGGSAKKTVNGYMKAMQKCDYEKAQSYEAFDWKNYYTDYYSEENLENLMDDDDSWYSDYDDVEDIYDDLEDDYDYSGTIKSGKDVYAAKVEAYNDELEDNEIKEFEITDVKDIDVSKAVIEDAIERYEDYCDKSDLDGKKYFNGKKVKKAKKVTVKFKDEDGSNKVFFYVVKYGNDWKIIDMESDY